MRSPCTINGCERERGGRGLCKAHYKRVLNTGDARPDEPIGANSASKMRGRSLQERMDAQARREGACLVWTGNINSSGYGRVYDPEQRQQRLTHVVAWEARHGAKPDGLELDHLCRNRACLNTGHLELVTHQENVVRARPYRAYPPKTHCKRGHELTPENTYIKKPSGKRRCYTCQRAEWVRLRENRKAGVS